MLMNIYLHRQLASTLWTQNSKNCRVCKSYLFHLCLWIQTIVIINHLRHVEVEMSFRNLVLLPAPDELDEVPLMLLLELGPFPLSPLEDCPVYLSRKCYILLNNYWSNWEVAFECGAEVIKIITHTYTLKFLLDPLPIPRGRDSLTQ